MTLYRSWMFVPGNNPRMLEKAVGIEVDAFIYDLEDAVPIKEKEQARLLVKRQLTEVHDSNTKHFVRINGWSTPWGKDDVEALVEKGLTGFVIPKTSGGQEIEHLDQLVTRLEERNGIDHGTVRFVPLIETALGLYHAFEIATASSRVLNLAFGSLDFTLDIGARSSSSENELLYARSQLIVVSRAAEIAPPIDTVYPNIRDLEGLKRQSQMAREFGFQGKLCIHPNQIETIEIAFSPSEEEILEAREIIDAYEQALSERRGAIEVNGKMVDPPVAERARKIVEWIASPRDRSHTKGQGEN